VEVKFKFNHPVVGTVGCFACNSECYGNCDHCPYRVIQQIGVYEDLEHFRGKRRW